MNFADAFDGIVTCDLSDACDGLGISAVTTGLIQAVYEGCRPICGPAYTVDMSPAGRGPAVLGTIEAIVDAQPGAVLVFATAERRRSRDHRP